MLWHHALKNSIIDRPQSRKNVENWHCAFACFATPSSIAFTKLWKCVAVILCLNKSCLLFNLQCAAGSYRMGINDPNRTFWHFCKKWPRLSVSSSGQKIHFMASKNHLNLWPLVIGQSRFVPQVVYTYTAIQRDTAWLWCFKEIKSKIIFYVFDILSVLFLFFIL